MSIPLIDLGANMFERLRVAVDDGRGHITRYPSVNMLE